jgi:hypothetical protein
MIDSTKDKNWPVPGSHLCQTEAGARMRHDHMSIRGEAGAPFQSRAVYGGNYGRMDPLDRAEEALVNTADFHRIRFKLLAEIHTDTEIAAGCRQKNGSDSVIALHAIKHLQQFLAECDIEGVSILRVIQRDLEYPQMLFRFDQSYLPAGSHRAAWLPHSF